MCIRDSIWDVEQSGENTFTVAYEVDQQIKEGDQTRNVSETYTAVSYTHLDVYKRQAQSREGKIHALQIAKESSVRRIQEQSKKLVSGRLRDVAIQKIDEQREALVSMIGDNQVDYRFFIGFKPVSYTHLDVYKRQLK